MKTLPRQAVRLALAILLLSLSAGCLYPKDHTPGHDGTARGSARMMQTAVESYRETTGLLPLLNADASVPRYEKYRIDFAKLKRMGYITGIPDAAFENGGPYLFLILDEETKPLVKLLDVAVHQAAADLQRKMDSYRRSHDGAVPAGTEAYPGFRYVDFGLLGSERPDSRSMYSGNPLEWMVDDAGKVYADYGIDIAKAVSKLAVAPGIEEDLRHRLVEASDFVPVYSPEYRWADGKPAAVKPQS